VVQVVSPVAEDEAYVVGLGQRGRDAQRGGEPVVLLLVPAEVAVAGLHEDA
jgi:hypothetical protein